MTDVTMTTAKSHAHIAVAEAVDSINITKLVDIALAAAAPPIAAAVAEYIARAIEATDHPHDVFLTGDPGTWVKAQRVFAALARAGGDPKEAGDERT